MINTIKNLLHEVIDVPAENLIVSAILLTAVSICAAAAYFITKGALNMVYKMLLRTPIHWDDDLLTPRFLRSVAKLSPAIVVSWLLPECLASSIESLHWLDNVTMLYIVWTVMKIAIIFINNLYNAMSIRENMKAYAVNGVFQMFKLIVIAVALIVAMSIIIGKTPYAIITALGASAAVLMLVFKDTILGLVAGVQLTANKMLKKGDWIVVPKHNANGEVIDVSLTTVKVRNWDNSVTTVPPYILIADSFQNFAPMQTSGGRRVKRSILIDVNTVRFCTQQEIDRLQQMQLIKPNDAVAAQNSVNLQLLRRYLEHFLAAHPEINKSATYMVRQLDPTPHGLPLELYFFVKNTAWKEYERVQSDIFDHIYAVINAFGLSIYQSPAGRDITPIHTAG